MFSIGGPAFRPYNARKYEPRFAKYNYFLAKGFSLTEKIQDEIGSGPNAVSAFYCIGADV